MRFLTPVKRHLMQASAGIRVRFFGEQGPDLLKEDKQNKGGRRPTPASNSASMVVSLHTSAA
jgi:hypothetical protein